MDTPTTPWLGLSDPVAALTHFFAAGLAGIAVVRLWHRSEGMPARRLSVIVFALSMLALFLASGSYHACFEPHKAPLRRVDHAAIYVLIAGTFTPLVAHLTQGRFRAAVLVAVWSFALAGVIFKLFFFGMAPEWIDTGLYLAMGWFGVVPGVVIIRSGVCTGASWLGLGAACYTGGALCDVLRWPVLVPGVFGPHEVFHIAVIGGTGSFLALILRHIVPVPAVSHVESAPAV